VNFPSPPKGGNPKFEIRNNDQNSNVQNSLPHLYPPPPKGRGRIKEGVGELIGNYI